MIYLVYDSVGNFYTEELNSTELFWDGKVCETKEDALAFIDQLKNKWKLTKKYMVMSVEENV